MSQHQRGFSPPQGRAQCTQQDRHVPGRVDWGATVRHILRVFANNIKLEYIASLVAESCMPRGIGTELHSVIGIPISINLNFNDPYTVIKEATFWHVETLLNHYFVTLLGRDVATFRNNNSIIQDHKYHCMAS